MGKSAVIFNIQKFCINDGPGIRTTVFFKGCPLDCAWCHNPESKIVTQELMYDAKKCIGCGKCMSVCPMGCHSINEEGMHEPDRKNCVVCGKCAEVCYAEALEMAGYEKTVDEVIAEVMKDEIFYQNSGGGLTVSGGEPMAQFGFVYELLKAAKGRGLHVCMETCGFSSEENYRKIAEYVDIFLFDYKLTDPDEHEKYTGQKNELILSNLRMLDSIGAKIVLRCPIIPGINDNDAHFGAIAALANELDNVLEINVEPYHPLGSGKAAMLGKEYKIGDISFPEEETVKGWIEKIKANTSVEVKKA